MRIGPVLVVVLAACDGGGSAAVDAGLPPPPPTDAAPVASTPVDVAIADLDGDGKPDVVVASFGSNTVSAFRNTTATGAMTPTFAARIDHAAGGGPHNIAIADLNDDGKLDLAVANINANTVSVFINTSGTGAAPSFAAKVDFQTGMFGDAAVAIGDFTGDGKPDLAVTNEISNVVSILVNATPTAAMTPIFEPMLDLQTGKRPQSIAVADFNGDGKPDLAVANFGPGDASTVAVLLDTTASPTTPPTFGAKLDLTTGLAGTMVTKVVAGDFNGDGRPDLAVGGFVYGTLVQPAPVSVFLNTTQQGAATPSFAANVAFATTVIHNPDPAVGDFNDDGKLDLAIADGIAMVAVLLGTTDSNATAPTFAGEMDFPSGTQPLAVASGDINGDGKPDLAIANSGSSSVSLLLDTTAMGAMTPSFAASIDLGTGP
jgi:hypothetical protein